MSIIRAIKLRLGLSVTPANNFALTAEADNGTMKLVRESGQDIMLVDAAGKVAFPQMGQSLTSNGYVKLPGGLIIQWGTGSIAVAGNGQSTTYPIPFPNGVLSLHAQSLAGASVVTMSVQIVDVGYFNIWAGVGTPGFTWIAIGH